MADECKTLLVLFREEWSERERRGEVSRLSGIEWLILKEFAEWVDERRRRLLAELLEKHP